MKAPLVGILAATAPPPPNSPFVELTRSCVNNAYVHAVAGAGAVPLVLPVPQTVSRELVLRMLDSLDGLLVPGGNDVDPSLYREVRSVLLQETDRHVDDFHLLAIRSAWERGIPILGICRGIQIINVAAGGSLWQDVSLASGCDASTTARHIHLDDYRRGCHQVEILPDSILSHALEISGEICVNSLHHQAIKEPGNGFRISATAVDGIVEAIESLDLKNQWTLAVQWHPEVMTSGTEPHMDLLFKAFAAVCADRSSRC